MSVIRHSRAVSWIATPTPSWAAEVSLVWSHEDNGVTSHAVRNSISDASGNFRFSQLGPGTHTLNVTATGFQGRHIEQELAMGAEVKIELSALATVHPQ